MPDQYHSKTVSTEYSASDVAHHYFMYKQKISQIIVRDKKQFIKPFNNLRFNLSTKKYIFNISKPPSSPPLKGFTGLDLDFVLGRAFLAVKRKDKDIKYSLYKFVMQTAPAFILLIFIILLIIDLFLNSFYVANKVAFNESSFLSKLLLSGAVNIVLTIFWALYILMPLIQGPMKLQIENDYETDVREFVKKFYADIYSDFLVARRYSRSIKFNYSLGISFIFKNHYKTLGPFGVV